MATEKQVDDLVFALWDVARIDVAREVAREHLLRVEDEVAKRAESAALEIVQRYCMRDRVEEEVPVVAGMIRRSI
jgi:hypothetical protein